jgi:hypothetical protein
LGARTQDRGGVMFFLGCVVLFAVTLLFRRSGYE